jgi:hypothetical protein
MNKRNHLETVSVVSGKVTHIIPRSEQSTHVLTTVCQCNPVVTVKNNAKIVKHRHITAGQRTKKKSKKNLLIK